MRWSGSIRTGDEVERRSAVREVAVKQGRSGALAFVTVGHEFRRDGELLVDEEQDLVYRSQPPGAPRPVARREPPTAYECDTRFEFDTDPVTLFQFSALTGNSHRIHYDHRYTTEVEGYPDLVVHGPLLALLLLEIPRREGSTVDTFTYRISRPAFAGARVAVGRGPGGELTAGAIGAPPSITGVVNGKA